MASFEQLGMVSLWLFCAPENPADANKDILRDFCGLDWYDLDEQEGVVKDVLTAVHALIEPLSYSASFLSNAVSAAGRIGIKEAFGVLAQYDFAYDSARLTRPVARDPLFLGAFRWHE